MKRTSGFTLVELVVVVAIIGIIAGIAFPQYRQYLIRSNRAAAKQFMLDVASRQEQFVLDQRSYTNSLANLSPLIFPPQLNGKYTQAITAPGNTCAAAGTSTGAAIPAPSYAVTLTAAGTQSSDGPLCMDSLGNKTPAAKWDN